MIIIFIGPPYAGKDTQGKLLSKKFNNLPIFSMGHLIREAQRSGNEIFIKAYAEYSLKGLHLPTEIKFPLLKERMDQARDGFILDNFPATRDDLSTLEKYLLASGKKVDKVIYLNISNEEMKKRFEIASRGRKDDHPEIIIARRDIQNKDRVPVLEFYRNQGLLLEINGEGDIYVIHEEILKGLTKKQII
jgi:adenylate kinase